MPFSSFNDPADVARSHGALEQAWQQVAAAYDDPEIARVQRERLAHIIASYALTAANEHDLIERAIKRFRETA